jgi:hypothetical protein
MPNAQLHAAILDHLRSAGEPVREAFLFERIGGSDLATPDLYLAALVRLEVDGRVHVDPVHDEVKDPAPFQPRFWRIID